MTLSPEETPAPEVKPTKTVTVYESGKRRHHSAEVTVTVTEDIFFDCDEDGDCTPTATSFSGPKVTSAPVSSFRRHRHHRFTKTKAPEEKAPEKSMPTPCGK